MAYIGNRVVAGVGSAVKVDLDAPTNALRVKNDGKIGIGKTDPTVELDVAGTVKATAFQGDGSSLTGIESLPAAIDVNGSAPDDSLAIDSSGNVGIGTTSPTSSKLHIDGGDLRIQDVTPNIYFYSEGAVNNVQINANISDAAQGGIAILENGNTLIQSRTNFTQFYSANTERMRITSTGAVGIGTTSPASLLHLSSGSPRITLTDTGTGADHRINADSSVGNLGFEVDYNSDTASPAVVFTIKGSEKLRINTDGDVLPGANGTQDFGSTSLRWANIYTSDLHLNNGIGNYTIVEGEEDLFLYNNKNGKTYKFVLAEVDPSEAPKKMEK